MLVLSQVAIRKVDLKICILESVSDAAFRRSIVCDWIV